MVYAFGDFDLDTDRVELRCRGELRRVEPQVFDVLAYLVRCRDRVVSKEELLDNVWGDRFVSESAVTTRIKAARRAVDDDGDRQAAIRTAHGRGYRFVADVTERPAAAASSPNPVPVEAAPPDGRAAAAIGRAAAPPGGTPAIVADIAPPIGRQAECAQLDACLAEAGAGRGMALLLCGEAGAGTSTLLDWLAARAAAAGWRVGRGEAASIERAWPYAPVLEAGADLCRRNPAVLEALHRSTRQELERAIAGQHTDWNGDGAHQRLFLAASEVLRIAADGVPGALLIVDDVHEADEASLRLLHYLARCTIGQSAIVAFGHRAGPLPAALDDVRESLLARGTARALSLRSLERAAIRQLLDAQLGGVDDDTLEHALELSGGLPFLALEVARRLQTRGNDPDSLDDLLVGGLGAGARRLTQRLALMGTTFDTEEILAVAECPEAEAFRLVDAAVSHRVLERGGVDFRFRHPLVRDVLLRRLSEHDRRIHHRAIAAGLLAVGSSPARVAHHLLAGGDRRAALPHALVAAETEAGVGAYRNALELVDSVRVQAEGADRARLLALRADLLVALGDAGALDAYHDALAAAGPDRRASLRARLVRAAVIAGDLRTAAAALADLGADSAETDDDDAGAILLARGMYAYATGDLDAAWSAAEEAYRLVVQGRRSWQLLDLVGLQGLIAHNRGQWFDLLHQELRRAPQAPSITGSLFDSHLCVAEYLLYGPTPYEQVLELTSALRVSAEQTGTRRATAFAAALAGEAALLAGDLARAESELTEAVELHRSIGATAGESHCLQRLAELRLVTGDREAANRLLRRALPLARWSVMALHLVQRIYGTMIRAAADPVEARALVDRAEATLGDDDNCMFCGIMLTVPAAVACAEAGDVAEARRYLAAAEANAQLWEGTAWQAATMEARAHVVLAEARRVDHAAAHGEGEARGDGAAGGPADLFDHAARLFDAAGQPLDATRCRVARARVGTALVPSARATPSG